MKVHIKIQGQGRSAMDGRGVRPGRQRRRAQDDAGTAIKKLFENVPDEEDEAAIMPDEGLKTGLNSYEQQKRQKGQGRYLEEIEEKSRLHVIRGKLA